MPYSKIPSIFDHVVRNSSTIKSNYHLDYALDQAHIAHTIMFGCYPLPEDWRFLGKEEAAIENRNSHYCNQMHTWITVDTDRGKAIVDYRARATIGSEGNTPNGVFLLQSYPHMKYKGWKASKIFSEQSVLHFIDPFTYPCPDHFGEEQLEAMTRPEYQAYGEALRRGVPVSSIQAAETVRVQEEGTLYPQWGYVPLDETRRALENHKAYNREE